MTGTHVTIEMDAMTAQDAATRRTHRRQRLLRGLFALAFLAAVTLPVTIEGASMIPGVAAALAASNDNGTGDGQGNGKGNGKGRGDEFGGGKGPPRSGGGDPDDDDDDDHGDDDDDDDGDDHSGGFGGRDTNPGGGGGERDANGFGETDDEIASADATEAVDGITAEGPVGLPAPTALPTIQQVFSLGEESVLDADQELLAIENGWGAAN
jgi:hypothetical protein